jgi:hypothetical protein
MQLLRLLNQLLERHPESRRRLLAWHTPIIVPVWPQVSTHGGRAWGEHGAAIRRGTWIRA